MVEHQETLGNTASTLSLDAALADWFILGLYAGFRLSEWAQPSNIRKYATFQRAIDNSSRAVTANDFSFDDDYSHVTICWRFQKNGQNGEKVTFAASKDPSRCPVAAAHRIIERATSLNNPPDHPVALYKDSLGSRRFITDTDIALALRRAASVVYNITDTTLLDRWTSHSLRVGACVLLHATGASALDIQRRLRWRSDTFMMYLRNTLNLAEAHTDAISNSTSRIR